MFERGVFTLSFDLELAWGEFYRDVRGRVDGERLLRAREAMRPLLGLLATYQLSATFAVVGHLALADCPGHESDPRPTYAFGPPDWYGAHPPGGENKAPEWYGRSLVAAIAAARPQHDIGAHGYTHAPLDAAGAGPAVARHELAASARALRAVGVEPVSFVFPRNGISYLEMLTEQGFKCYRAPDAQLASGTPRPLRSAGHLLAQTLALAPRTGLAEDDRGLGRLPSSMLFLSREGWRRALPMTARVSRALKGLARARKERRVFHLWLHCEDLVPDTGRMLGGLAEVLQRAETDARAGSLEVLNMAALAARMDRCASSA